MSYLRPAAVGLLAVAASIFLAHNAPPVAAQTASAVAAGSSHTCAVTITGGVKCWGWNDFRTLGDGTTTSSAIPVDAVGLTSGVAAVAAGPVHTCALTADGGMKCWGYNHYGQLGDGSSGNFRATPVDVTVLSSSVASIAVGHYHTCALTTAGGVKCWGRNDFGQLGDGTTSGTLEPNPTPVDVVGLESGVAAVAAGQVHTCALTATGAVKCWGSNGSGQLGDGAGGDGNFSPTPVDVLGLSSGVAAIATKNDETCALITAGDAKCWGQSYGSVPQNVTGLSGGVTITVGIAHACVLTPEGGVKCWRQNGSGQLGDGTTTDRTTPVDVSGLPSGVAAVAAGGLHTCALTTAGGIKCWGNNESGQLGDGTGGSHGDFSAVPVPVVGFEPTPTPTPTPTATPTPTPPPAVGGIVELQLDPTDLSAHESDSAAPAHFALAGLAAAALVALGAGGWYARRRRLG